MNQQSLHGGSNAIGKPFPVTSFQETPVYSGKSHLERNGAQEIEVILSSILHGWPIADEEELLDPRMVLLPELKNWFKLRPNGRGIMLHGSGQGTSV